MKSLLQMLPHFTNIIILNELIHCGGKVLLKKSVAPVISNEFILIKKSENGASDYLYDERCAMFRLEQIIFSEITSI